MSRKQLEALGHTHVESDLPPIVRDWCIGDWILCLVEGEFQYMDREVWKQLKPFLRGSTVLPIVDAVNDSGHVM